MPTVSKSFTPSDIIQGPADIWIGIGAPASAVPPVQYTNTLQLDGSGQPPDSGSAGFSLGLTEGPASISINPKFQEIKADQIAGPVDCALVTMATEVDFAIKESKLANFPNYFAGLLTGTYTAVVSGANPAANFLQVGTMRTSVVQTHTLMLIVPRRDSSAKWVYAFFYKAYLKSSVTIAMDRKKENIIKMKWGCIADTSRVAKDQVGQIVRMT